MGKGSTPTIDQFRPVVLAVLADGQERSFRELCHLVAEKADLSEEILRETVPSGDPRYMNRINWACSALFQAGLVERPKRGIYRITSDGRSVAARNLSEYSEKDMLEWPAWQMYQNEIAARKTAVVASTSNAHSAELDPIEAMETAQQVFNAKTETELRKRLQSSSPEFFENAVIDMLWAMGYGGTHGEKQHVGRSSDGGIDGIIRQDALGLQNVYVQAKRYTDGNNVQRPAIQQFYGALASKSADRGVFITTSKFSNGARQEAESYHGKTIVLIDGIKLTSLMLTYGVAVNKTREFTLYEIDNDFFDEETA